MDKVQIKKVIEQMCVKAYPKAQKPEGWDLERISEAVWLFCAKHRVEPELALAQGIAECHWGMNPKARRSRMTKNVFNVGNVDDGGNRYFPSWEAGIEAYSKLMQREYLWPGEGNVVTMAMMEKHDFTRPRGGRYASALNYTKAVKALYKAIKGLDSRLRGNDGGKSGNDGDSEPRGLA